MSASRAPIDNSSWTDGVVAVLKSGHPVGSGFVAYIGAGTEQDPSLVVTCAHVLTDAGWPYQKWDEPIRLRFQAGSARTEAYAVAEWYRDDIAEDLAILTVPAPLPPAVKALPLWPAAAAVDHDLYTWGYPKPYPDGIDGKGQARRLTTVNGQRRLRFQSDEITSGHSGGPLWDTTWRRVVGITHSGHQTGDDGERMKFTSFAVPAETIVDVCDRLGLTEPEPEPAGETLGIWVGVPTPPNHFVGRDQLVHALTEHLTGAAGISLSVVGYPGVGKTALAVAVAHHDAVRSHFNHGVLWAGLGPGANALELLNAWAAGLGADLSDLDTVQVRAEAVKRLIGQRRMLLVIDDAWDLEAARALRCGGPNCCHLLTTRDKDLAREFAGPANTRIVPPLENDPAFTLLRQIAPEACAANPEMAMNLAQSVGGLPLVLELLGGYLAVRKHSLTRQLSQAALTTLADPGERLRLAAARLGGDGQAVTLQKTLALSLDGLGESAEGQAAVAAFYALGAFAPKPNLFSWAAAEYVADTSLP